ncbi:hypothetical protein C0Q70_13024 [Pomacea canaliculata]|uniref:Mutator-like transposase domain-containing protein n=1 Tax=Pomacea canaliculata TaxID=400727 RepID=A0A2T7P353_POMCA|nr:hypothetical protein C0Q70_13024 [Pomacea canaliculata]
MTKKCQKAVWGFKRSTALTLFQKHLQRKEGESNAMFLKRGRAEYAALSVLEKQKLAREAATPALPITLEEKKKYLKQLMEQLKKVQSGHRFYHKTTYNKACTTVQNISMQAAVAQEYEQAEEVEGNENRDIHVLSDGTWMTVGFSSQVGVVTTIGMKNGKVIDTQAKSKVCKSCDSWKKQDPNSDKYCAWAAPHAADFTLTHEGFSGLMEASGTCDIFKRSVEQYKLRYTGFVGDGYTNTYKKVSDSMPYGRGGQHTARG